MKKRKWATIEDYFKAGDINYMDMVEYVVQHKTFDLEMSDFTIIENGFREKWNASSGALLGDGDMKVAIYRHIEAEMANGKIKALIPQEVVDGCVDLMLDYLESIGQWYSDFSKN